MSERISRADFTKKIATLAAYSGLKYPKFRPSGLRSLTQAFGLDKGYNPDLQKEQLQYPDSTRLVFMGDTGTTPATRDNSDQIRKLNPRPDAVCIPGDTIYPEHGQRYEKLLEIFDGYEIFATDGERDSVPSFLNAFAIDDLFHTRRFGPVLLIGLTNVGRNGYPFYIQEQKMCDAIQKLDAPINIGLMHHPPLTVGRHPSYSEYQRKYGKPGLHCVISGDNHNLALVEDDIPHFTVGTGGQSLYPVNGEFRPEGTKIALGGEEGDFGFLMLDAFKTNLKLRSDSDTLTVGYKLDFTFITRSGYDKLFKYEMTVI